MRFICALPLSRPAMCATCETHGIISGGWGLRLHSPLRQRERRKKGREASLHRSLTGSNGQQWERLVINHIPVQGHLPGEYKQIPSQRQANMSSSHDRQERSVPEEGMMTAEPHRRVSYVSIRCDSWEGKLESHAVLRT